MENPLLIVDKSIPWLLSNAQLGGIDPPKIRIKKLNNGLIVAILGLIDPELYYDAKHSGGDNFRSQKICGKTNRKTQKIKAA